MSTIDGGSTVYIKELASYRVVYRRVWTGALLGVAGEITEGAHRSTISHSSCLHHKTPIWHIITWSRDCDCINSHGGRESKQICTNRFGSSDQELPAIMHP